MKQNYYEILEVDKNASPEIIKKAYSTLVKKYHPDLQNDNVKHLYEEKLKLINEAYDVLSNSSKRANYNRTITNQIEILQNRINKLSKENEILRKQANIYSQTNSKPKTTQNTFKKTSPVSSHYNNKNINNNKYNNSFTNFIAFLLTALIVLALLQLPFIRNIIVNFVSI